MVRSMPQALMAAIAVASIGIACDSEKPSTTTSVEHALSARVPAAPPPETPAPEPAAAEPPEEIETPEWVNEYAAALCKRVGVCRQKMLGAVPPQQKTMLAMQIPSQEACVQNTTTFKEKAPKAELDDTEKQALANCVKNVSTTACGNIQTGKVPECQTLADLVAEAQGRPSGQAAAGTP